MTRLQVLALIATTAVAAIAQDSAKETTNNSATEWNDRGLSASARGDHAEAERLFNIAIERWKSQGPGFEPHLGITQLNLGQTYSALAKRAESAKIFEEALGRLRRSLGVRSEWTLTAMNLLGAADLMLGEGARAEPLFTEALPVEREFFPKSFMLARTLEGLATINVNANKLDVALAQAEEALPLAIASEGEESLDAGLAYATVAEVYRVSRRNERALPLYRKARAIYEKILGPEHTRVASILSQEGLILMADRKYALAEKGMVRALDIVKKSCPECVYELWVGESNLGLLRLRQKRYADADKLLSHSLALQEKYIPHPGQDMAGTLQALAIAREKLRRFDDAARLNQRADMLKSYR
jgi:tetratricopeptide (TPR) repeat protein